MSFSSKNKKFLISSDGAIQDVCPHVEVAGRAQFNMATATYATVAYNAVWFINKTHLKLLQEGFNIEPQQIFG